jgi:hypothetical protein
MSVYRCFFIDSGDKVQGIETIDSPTEADAVYRGEHMLRGASHAAAVEIWDHGRLVGQIKREAVEVNAAPHFDGED